MTLSVIDNRLALQAQWRLKSLYHGIGLALSTDRMAVLSELALAKDMASEHGWDGFGAQPMADEAHQVARSFLFALPINVCNPSDVDIDPSGRALFEWDQDAESLRRVIVDPSGELLVIVIGEGNPVSFASHMEGGLLPSEVVAVLCHSPNA